MGYRNAGRALTVSAGMPPTPRLVLVAMALRAADASPDPTAERTYWGGHTALMADLGWPPTDTARRNLRRALAALSGAGLVTLDDRTGVHRTGVYRLHLGAPNRPP